MSRELMAQSKYGSALAGRTALSKAERMSNLAQHFTCWLTVETVIKGLVEGGEQGHAKHDNCQALQHSFSPQVKESIFRRALALPAYIGLTLRARRLV
jgi:hypothetical protein